jgi:photosystem II stability/assembly factor-like uncharacterized protein
MKIRRGVFQVVISILALLEVCVGARAQWVVQSSNTTADLRGIHSVDGKMAWASGTNGTVLRTVDGGEHWQACAVPPGAEKLDFRGIQAFNAKTAIVMSSGKGDLSRLYKTTDGCETWKLVFTNPDKDGFWDAIQFSGVQGTVLGDPVNGEFEFWSSMDAGDSWSKGLYFPRSLIAGLMHRGPAPKNEGVFAASNSALFFNVRQIVFVTGSPSGSRLFLAEHIASVGDGGSGGSVVTLPLATGSESAGAFSITSSDWNRWVVVGGDYRKPGDPSGSAAYSVNPGDRWHPATTMPRGYRSAVAWDADAKTWITVGPNGTDISTDNGKNWRALRPDVARGEAADADRNWNALSLPFVVGPKGRIGKRD